MNILLIMPDAAMHKFRIGSFVRSSREAPLTLTTLAALTQEHPDVSYKLVDESVDVVPLDYKADLVGISILTGTSRRGYALADHFRAKGIPVVLGGVHTSILPEEAHPFADALVIGMADATWVELINDFKQGKLKKEYREQPTSGKYTTVSIPSPRYDLQRKSAYMVPYTIQATRGCMHCCDFCSVPVIFKKFLRRPVEDVIRDIKAIPARRFALNDVSPVDDVEYAKELFKALIPLKKRWGGLATLKVTEDPELMELIERSGCEFLLLGFESANQNVLNTIRKRHNSASNYKESMRILHKHGIIVQGCFVFGFDHDTTEVFQRTVDLVQDLKIDIPRYSIYTPYPGTSLFTRLESERRILSYDWADYNTMKVVFKPKLMTPVELYEGFRWAYRETFRMKRIMQRVIASGPRFPITFFGNLTYIVFVKRLYANKGFEMPVHVPEAIPIHAGLETSTHSSL